MNMYKHCKMDKHYTLTQLTSSFSFCLSTLNRFHLKIVSQWQRQLKHLSGLIHIKYSRSDLPLKFQHHHPNVALLFNSTKLISFSLTKSIKICCRKSHNNSNRDDDERILKKIWKKNEWMILLMSFRTKTWLRLMLLWLRVCACVCERSQIPKLN